MPLGLVPRNYENPRHFAYRTVTRDPWEWANHMLPDENGELMVVARCDKHYAWLSQADVKAGVTAVCTNRQCKKGRA